MSCQPPHWARRNVSPASKQRPFRATVPVSLMTHSPSSPTKNEGLTNLSTAKEANDGSESPTKTSVKEKPTVFLGPRGEKSKTLNLRTQPQEHYIRRTASLDAIYRASPWKTDTVLVGYCGHFMVDKATQTPEEWSEAYQNTASQWKPMVTGGEQLEVKFIRQKLQQRTNQGSRNSGGLLCCQRQSPIQADHSAISSANNGGNSCSSTQYGSALGVVPKPLHTGPVTGPIPINHGPQQNVPVMPSSVEGLNQEIEKLVLKDNSAAGHESDISRVLEPPPEGHRAPIAELFHSVQSSSSGRDSRGSSGGTSSRSHSISPAIPIIPGNPDFSISPSSDDVESAHKLGTSPHINHFLSREPPDGCERVKIVDEPRRCPFSSDLFPGYNSSKPEVTYVLLPSQSSAFCPLYKELGRSTSNPLFNSYTVMSSTQTTPNCHK